MTSKENKRKRSVCIYTEISIRLWTLPHCYQALNIEPNASILSTGLLAV